MGYSEIAEQVNSQRKIVVNKIISIEKVSLRSVWCSSTYESLSKCLKSATNKGWIENENLSTFSNEMY